MYIHIYIYTQISTSTIKILHECTEIIALIYMSAVMNRKKQERNSISISVVVVFFHK